MKEKFILSQIIILIFITVGCSIDKSSKIRPGNYKKDLEILFEKSPELFGEYSSEEIYEGILDYQIQNENLSYQELISNVKDTLNWFDKVEVYEKVNSRIRKYMDDFGGVIKNDHGQYDFVENILRNPDILGSPYDRGFKDLAVAIDLFSNDGAIILGFRTKSSYLHHVNEILTYEKENKEVLFNEVVLDDLDHYQNTGIIKKVIDIEDISKYELRIWYEIVSLYYEKLSHSKEFKLKREKAIKGWQYFNKQPQLFD